jgi:hypothetical protein
MVEYERNLMHLITATHRMTKLHDVENWDHGINELFKLMQNQYLQIKRQ